MSKSKPDLTGHSPFGPSKAHRWMNCPGSYNAEKGLEGKESAAAAEGTLAHSLGEIALFKGESTEEVQGAFPDDMRRNIQTYVDFVHNRARGNEIEPEVVLSRETGIKHPDAAILYGSADAVIHDPLDEVLDIIDLKYGRRGVEVIDNPQLLMYAGLALGQYEIDDNRLEAIRVSIVQPRVKHKDGPCRTEIYSKREAEEFMEDVQDAIVEALNPDAPRVAGDWCTFCLAGTNCAERSSAAFAINSTEAYSGDFEIGDTNPDQQLPAVIDDPKVELADPNALSLKQLGMVAAWGESFLKDVKARALELAMSGVEIPYCKVVLSEPREKWEDDDLALKFIRKNSKLSVKDFVITKPPTPAQTKKKLEKLGVNSPKLLKMIVTPEGQPTIVGESNSRPAIELKVLDPVGVEDDDEEALEFLEDEDVDLNQELLGTGKSEDRDPDDLELDDALGL